MFRLSLSAVWQYHNLLHSQYSQLPCNLLHRLTCRLTTAPPWSYHSWPILSSQLYPCWCVALTLVAHVSPWRSDLWFYQCVLVSGCYWQNITRCALVFNCSYIITSLCIISYIQTLQKEQFCQKYDRFCRCIYPLNILLQMTPSFTYCCIVTGQQLHLYTNPSRWLIFIFYCFFLEAKRREFRSFLLDFARKWKLHNTA